MRVPDSTWRKVLKFYIRQTLNIIPLNKYQTVFRYGQLAVYVNFTILDR